MRSFLNNQSIDCTAGRLSISSAAPVLCGGNVGCIPRKLFIRIGFRRWLTFLRLFYVTSEEKDPKPISLNGLSQSSLAGTKSFDIFITFSLQKISFLLWPLSLRHLISFKLTNAPKFSFFSFIYFFMENMCKDLLSFLFFRWLCRQKLWESTERSFGLFSCHTRKKSTKQKQK